MSEKTDLRRCRRSLGMACVSAAIVAATMIAGTASAIAAAHRPHRAYHPAFRRLAGTVLLSGSNYIAVAGAGPGQVQLINTSTGRSVDITQPGCVPDAVGGNWLALTCTNGSGQADLLYDIAENRALPFTPSPSCATGPCDEIAAIGADWVALTPPCSDPSTCVTSFQFENLSTGETRSDPTNATTRIDLDSQQLAAPLCKPLSVPSDNQSIENGPAYAGWGSVTLDRSYGIEAGSGGVFLQRCGSRAKTLLTRTVSFKGCAARACPPANSRSMIIWQSAAGRLGGALIRGLRRFQIDVPSKVDPSAQQLKYVRADPYTLALAGRTLYLQTPSGTVWAAQIRVR